MIKFIFLLFFLYSNTTYSQKLNEAGKNHKFILPSINSNIDFIMNYVPAPISFPIWSDDSRKATVFNSFLIGQTELTYELWKLVYDWAIKNGYKFNNEGSRSRVIKNKDKLTEKHPIAWISWLDAIIWANALTEFYNTLDTTNDKLDFVYYSLSDKGNLEPIKLAVHVSRSKEFGTPFKPIVADTNGFRLLSSDEWELAARWNGNNNKNTVSGYNKPYFTKGNSVSGATKDLDDLKEAENFACFDPKNKKDIFGPPDEVAKRSANALGLYDISGNLWEWTYDWCNSGFSMGLGNLLFGDENSPPIININTGEIQALRIVKGGCYECSANFMKIGYEHGSSPEITSKLIGFRIARTFFD